MSSPSDIGSHTYYGSNPTRVGNATSTSHLIELYKHERYWNDVYRPIGRKIYGTIIADGHSRVHNGDTYVYNIAAPEEKRTWLLARDIHRGYFGRSGDNLSQLTISRRAQVWLLPWLLRMTSEKLSIRSKGRSDSRWFFHVDLLSRYRVYLEFSVGWGLHIYCPRFHTIVPSHASIMLAAQNGDIIAVRSLLLEGSAKVADVTLDNLTPLFYAIQNGHNHVVEELLYHGADPNQTFGRDQTSALQWAVHWRDEAIIRTLIRNGACLQHISRLGWSILSYLWIDKDHARPTCITLMHLLQTADPAEFRHSHRTLLDIHGFSVVNRVARIGTRDELRMLLLDGADITSVIELDWNAMFNATHLGNFDNLLELAPYFPDFTQTRDLRGWTLLHVAVAEGHEDIVRYLLENGADWQVKSWPSYVYIDESLHGKVCTPSEVARIESAEVEARYLRVVEDYIGLQASRPASSTEKVDVVELA